MPSVFEGIIESGLRTLDLIFRAKQGEKEEEIESKVKVVKVAYGIAVMSTVQQVKTVGDSFATGVTYSFINNAYELQEPINAFKKATGRNSYLRLNGIDYTSVETQLDELARTARNKTAFYVGRCGTDAAIATLGVLIMGDGTKNIGAGAVVAYGSGGTLIVPGIGVAVAGATEVALGYGVGSVALGNLGEGIIEAAKGGKQGRGNSKNTNQSNSSTKKDVPVKEKTVASNGLTYKSNPKHTLGQPGNRPDAGIEPRNSLELFGKSVPSTQKMGHRYTFDKSTNTLHRFFSDGHGVWHWSGSTNQGANSLKGSEVPNDIKNLFHLPKKGW